MVHSDATVSSLIDKDLANWDYNMLDNMFDEEELKAIKSFPLSYTNQEDMMIWKGTTNGLFLIRSAYHLAKEVEDRAKVGSSMGVPTSEVWTKIWHLKVLNVEKNFNWRACHDILPTRDNLLGRKIVKDSMCPICGLEVETTLHILWECPLAMDVCGGSYRFAASVMRMKSIFFVGLARQMWF
jgi:hypothetical protein